MNGEELAAKVEGVASPAFVKFLRTDAPEGHTHMARNELEKRLTKWGESPTEVDEKVHMSGSFFEALWNGDTEFASMVADDRNDEIGRSAGLW